ncbi:unnamed protein product, partial [Prorocentrum cordatum]
ALRRVGVGRHPRRTGIDGLLLLEGPGGQRAEEDAQARRDLRVVVLLVQGQGHQRRRQSRDRRSGRRSEARLRGGGAHGHSGGGVQPGRLPGTGGRRGVWNRRDHGRGGGDQRCPVPRGLRGLHGLRRVDVGLRPRPAGADGHVLRQGRRGRRAGGPCAPRRGLRVGGGRCLT